MPKSVIEAEITKVTKIKQGTKEDRQTFLAALATAVQDLTDKQWTALSDPAQEWTNAAAVAIKGKKTIKDFPDVGDVKPGKDDDGDDAAEEKPARGRKAAKDEDDEPEEKPSRRKAAKADDEEPEEKPARRAKKTDDDEPEEKPRSRRAAKDEDEPEEKPARRAKKTDDDDAAEEKPARGRKAAKDEDDEPEEKPARGRKTAKDDDDDKPARKAPAKDKPSAGKTTGVKPSGTGVKNSIKLAILEDTAISVDDLVAKLGKGGGSVSKVTVSNIRAEFRHTLKLLKEEGKLKGVEI